MLEGIEINFTVSQCAVGRCVIAVLHKFDADFFWREQLIDCVPLRHVVAHDAYGHFFEVIGLCGACEAKGKSGGNAQGAQRLNEGASFHNESP